MSVPAPSVNPAVPLHQAPVDLEPTTVQAAPPLEVPATSLIGLGREFADLYSAVLESPRSFFYFAFLTYYGAVISRYVTLDTELRPQPRLYALLLGESADDHKSTAIDKAYSFFAGLGPDTATGVLKGAGSAEGLAAALGRTPRLVLHYDEFKAFVDKATIENSVMLPMVASLFERREYENETKKARLTIKGADLSLIGACTVGTYETMFTPAFHSLGFMNRLWLVVDSATTRRPYPEVVPPDTLAILRQRVQENVARLHAAWEANAKEPIPYHLTPGAHKVYTTWYESRERSRFSKRLDTYFMKLLLLLATSTGRTTVEEDTAEAVRDLMDYQLAARRQCDPVDAEGPVARMEEKIRRVLAEGPCKGRELRRACHYERSGVWVFNTALANLKSCGDVAHDADSFRLSPVSP